MAFEKMRKAVEDAINKSRNSSSSRNSSASGNTKRISRTVSSMTSNSSSRRSEPEDEGFLKDYISRLSTLNNQSSSGNSSGSAFTRMSNALGQISRSIGETQNEDMFSRAYNRLGVNPEDTVMFGLTNAIDNVNSTMFNRGTNYDQFYLGRLRGYETDINDLVEYVQSGEVFNEPIMTDLFTEMYGEGYDRQQVTEDLLAQIQAANEQAGATRSSARARSGDASVLDGMETGTDEYSLYKRLLGAYNLDQVDLAVNGTALPENLRSSARPVAQSVLPEDYTFDDFAADVRAWGSVDEATRQSDEYSELASRLAEAGGITVDELMQMTPAEVSLMDFDPAARYDTAMMSQGMDTYEDMYRNQRLYSQSDRNWLTDLWVLQNDSSGTSMDMDVNAVLDYYAGRGSVDETRAREALSRISAYMGEDMPFVERTGGTLSADGVSVIGADNAGYDEEWAQRVRRTYLDRNNALDDLISGMNLTYGEGDTEITLEEYMRNRTDAMTYDEYQSALAYIDLMQRAEQEIADRWGDLSSNEDYAELSRSDHNEIQRVTPYTPIFNMVVAGNDPEVLNDERTRAVALNNTKAEDYLYYGYEYMTDEQRANFIYLYNKNPENPQEALDYLQKASYSFNALKAIEIQDTESEYANEHPFLGAITARGWNALNSISGVRNIGRRITGDEINAFDPSFYAGMRGQALDSAVASQLPTWGQYLYSAGTSAADSLLASAAGGPGMGATLMGAGAFNTTYQSGLAAGKSDDDAFVDALVDGAIEIGTERVSLGNAFSNTGGVAKRIGQQMLVEGSEEVTGEILRTLYDQIKNGENSEFNQRVAELEAQYYTHDEAFRIARDEWAANLLETFAVGGLSGGMMAGPIAGIDAIQASRTGSRIRSSGNVDNLMEIASTLPLDSEIRRMVERQQQASALSAAAAENARQQTEQAAAMTTEEQAASEAERDIAAQEAADAALDASEAHAQMNAQKDANTAEKAAADAQGVDGGSSQSNKVKPLSNAEVGRVFRAVMQQLDTDAQAVMVDNMSGYVEGILEEQGFGGDAALRADAAQAVLRVVSGTGTEADARLVASSDAATTAMNRLTARIETIENTQNTRSRVASFAQRNRTAQTTASNGDEPETVDNSVDNQPDASNVVTAPATSARTIAANVAEIPSTTNADAGIDVHMAAYEDTGDDVEYGATDRANAMPNFEQTAARVENVVQSAQIENQEQADTVRLAEYSADYGANADIMRAAYSASSGVSVDDYARAFSSAVQYGLDGQSFDVVRGYASLAPLTEAQARTAYELGRGMRIRQNTETQARAVEAQENAQDAEETQHGSANQEWRVNTGSVDLETLDDNQRYAVQALDELAPALGINVELYESGADSTGRYIGPNGYWDAQTRTLYLDVHAGALTQNTVHYTMMQTAGHELTHYIRQFADESVWDEYQDFVIGHLSQTMSEADFEAEVDRYTSRGMSRDAAIEEIVANASVQAIGDIRQTDLTNMVSENPRLFMTICERILSWVNRVREYIRRAFAGTSANTRVAREMESVANEMGRKWNAALANAARRANRMTEAERAEWMNQEAAQWGFDSFQSQPIAGEHIDERSWDSVKRSGSELFCVETNDVTIRELYKMAANLILQDVADSTRGQRTFIYNADGTLAQVTGQKRDTTPMLAELRDERGWSWDRIQTAFEAFADMDTGDFSTPKNTLTNRQAELMLDRVLRSGYTTLRGYEVAPSVNYMLATSGYQGSVELDIPGLMADYWQEVPNAVSFWDTAVNDELSAAIEFRRDAAANNQDTSEYDAQIDRESREEFLERHKRDTVTVSASGTANAQAQARYTVEPTARDVLSNREILASALESVAGSQSELRLLSRYRQSIENIESDQRRLNEINERIRAIRNGAEQESQYELRDLTKEAARLREGITHEDSQLLKLEATEPIRRIVAEARQTAREQERARSRERQQAAVERANERADARVERARAQTAQVRERAAERQRAAVEHAREVGNRKVERAKESVARTKYRDRVIKQAKAMREWLTTPTNKQHVPEFLRAPLGDFLESIDLRSVSSLEGKRQTQADNDLIASMERMRSALDNVRQQQQGLDSAAADFSGWLDLPPEFATDFGALKDQIKSTLESSRDVVGTPVNRMRSTQLRELSRMMQTLNRSIRQMNMLLVNANYSSAINAANDTMLELSALGQDKARFKAAAKANTFFNWSNTTPYYAFKRFGKGGKAIFEGLMTGWDKLAFNSKQVIDFANSAYTTQQVRSWGREVKTVELGNRKLQMTSAQIMSLYCLAKREQAMGHLMGGGIRIADIASGKRTIRQAENYTLTQSDVSRITGVLTADQRRVADALQGFMTGQCAEWGNEVSMRRFGYRAFTEANYFPIETDSNNRRGVDEQAHENSMFRLLNLSATKALTPNANNAIVIRDIFDVFTAHSADMAKYNALALPLLDTLKWYNFVEKTKDKEGKVTTRSVQKSMEIAYGTDAKKYFQNFIRDLNGVREAGRANNFIGKLVSNYKVAAVGANLRVGMLQITSMPRAAYVINPKYLAAGVVKINRYGRRMVRLAQENVGIAQWKSLGFYDTNISLGLREMIKHDQGPVGKIREASMKLAEWGDEWTMGVLYGAVESELKAQGVSQNSPAYRQMLNNRVREIVYQTQVIDSTMTRSDLMRDTKGISMISTAFMSEPTLMLNLLNDSIYERNIQNRAKRNLSDSAYRKWLADRGGSPHVVRNMAKAFGVTTFVMGFSAVVEALFNAERDDDEFETFREKFMDSLLGEDGFWEGTLFGNINLLDNVPIVKDIFGALMGNETSLMYNEWAITIVDGLKTLHKVLTEGGSDADIYRGVYKTLNGAGQLTGLPVGGLMREVASAYNTFVAEPMGWKRLQTYDNTEADAGDAIYSAMLAGDEDLVEFYYDRAEVYGFDEAKIANRIEETSGEAYVAGDIDAATITNVLSATRGFDTQNLAYTLARLDYERETGGLKFGNLKADYVAGLVDYETALKYKLSIDGVSEESARETLSKWDYMRETGRDYEDLRDDYLAGNITEAQAREAMAKYGGLTDEKIDEQFDRWDYYEAYGTSDGYGKYWRMYYALENGGNVDYYVQQYLASGSTVKGMMSSITNRYKKQYVELRGTAEGEALLERVLNLYVALGYDRNEQRQWLHEHWTDWVEY